MNFLPNLSLLSITDVQTPQERELKYNDTDVKRALKLLYDVTQRLAEFDEFKSFGIIYDPNKDEALLKASRSSVRVVVAAVDLFSTLLEWVNYFVPTLNHFNSSALQSALEELDDSVREVENESLISPMNLQTQAAWNTAVSQSDLVGQASGVGDDGQHDDRPHTESLSDSDQTPISVSSEMNEEIPESDSDQTPISGSSEMNEEIAKSNRDARNMPPPREMSVWAQRHFAYKTVFDDMLAEYNEALRHNKARIKMSRLGMPDYTRLSLLSELSLCKTPRRTKCILSEDRAPCGALALLKH